MTQRIGRRALFDELRAALADAPVKPSERSATAFSLAAFYADRPSPGALPPVVLRSGLPAVTTTNVGVCPPIELDDDKDRLA